MYAKLIAVKVERNQFERIVGNLLKQQPSTRKEERLGTRKTGKVIPTRTEPDQNHQPVSGTSKAKPEQCG